MSAACGPAPGALATFAYEGAFASRPLYQNLETAPPFASVLSGAGAWRSNTPGTIQGVFGWANAATGLVNNTRVDASDALGVVIPLRSLNGINGGVVGGSAALAGWQNSWTWQFWDGAYLRIRPGLVVTLHSAGNFYLKFAGGAIFSNQVYASLVDGSAVSGPESNCEATPWYIVAGCQPGGLAIVSTTARFS